MSDPLFDLAGRVAVVTGGIGQLGAEYAAGLAARGMKVAIFDIETEPGPGAQISASEAIRRSRSTSPTASRSSGRRTRSSPPGVCRTCSSTTPASTRRRTPRRPRSGPFESYPEVSFDRVMDVNVKGTLLCCQVVGGRMAVEGRGSIVNVSSIYGILSPDQSLYEFRRAGGEEFVKPVAYSVSKSAILNLTRYLATYWAKSGVRVNTVTLAGVANDQPARVRPTPTRPGYPSGGWPRRGSTSVSSSFSPRMRRRTSRVPTSSSTAAGRPGDP